MKTGKWSERRKPHHLWTWFCEEHDNIYQEYVGLFNLTMSMRLESDIVISYMNTDRDMTDSLGHEWDRVGPAPIVPFSERTEKNPVAWAATNCDPQNNRTGYIKALMEHIGVDSFGDCLHTKDGFTERGPKLLQVDRLKRGRSAQRLQVLPLL